MEVIDEAQEKNRAKARYSKVLGFADEFFGTERILADGRGLGTTRDHFYVYSGLNEDGIVGGIEIRVTSVGVTVRVKDPKYLDKAGQFGEEYEKAHTGESVTLRYNLTE